MSKKLAVSSSPNAGERQRCAEKERKMQQWDVLPEAQTEEQADMGNEGGGVAVWNR